MKLNEIIEAAYILPALIDYLENNDTYAKEILDKNGITKPESFKPFSNLLNYHNRFIRRGIGDYDLLRSGLEEYFDHYLSDIWVKLGIQNQVLKLLDYGAGKGTYSDRFIGDNPNSVAICVDRDYVSGSSSHKKHNLSVNFEREPDWYMSYRDTFDIVLLSEILHCKNTPGQEYIINSSRAMLKRGGRLIVNENQDIYMQYRISKLKGVARPLVDRHILDYLLDERLFKLTNEIIIENHFIYVYEKL